MKHIKWLIITILVTGIALLSGCSSSDDDPRELLAGTWTAGYVDEDGCDISMEIILDDDGFFETIEDDDCPGLEDDFYIEAEGTWAMEGSAIVFQFSKVESTDPDNAPEVGSKYTGYYFLTDSGDMGLSSGNELFHRDSAGSGFYGTWVRDAGVCDEYVEITNVNDFAWYEVCGLETTYDFTGTYTRNGNKFTVNTGEGTEILYYMLIGNYMSLIPSDQLFSRDQDL